MRNRCKYMGEGGGGEEMCPVSVILHGTLVMYETLGHPQ